jgi:hypothetical protein
MAFRSGECKRQSIRRISAPMAPVSRTNVDFQIEFVPADGIRATSWKKRRPRIVAVLRQLSAKLISLTAHESSTL